MNPNETQDTNPNTVTNTPPVDSTQPATEDVNPETGDTTPKTPETTPETDDSTPETGPVPAETPQTTLNNETPIDSDIDTELTDEELIAQSEAVKTTIKAKVEKTYTKDEVAEMLAKALEMNKQDADEDEDDEDDAPSTVRVARFQKKFIKCFKNMNDDPYMPDAIVHAYDIFNEKTRRNVPWVTIVFQDDTEFVIPLETILKRAKTVSCELVQTKEEDISYNRGKVEKQEVKDSEYKQSGTGAMVKTKVTLKKYLYEIKLPNGELMIATPDVINW